jgi:ATPase family AAA domain-containing protein 3A/B
MANFLRTKLGPTMGLSVALMAGGTALCASDKDKYFDPDALERGAKALREIQNSPYAKRVFDQLKQEEATKLQELKVKEAEFNATTEQASIQKEQIRWEEQRKTMQQDAQAKAQLAQYNDELARKRAEAEHEKQRQRNMELVKFQEDSARRTEQQKAQVAAQIEAERRATEKYRADMEKTVQREKALAEAEGRAKERRANADLYRTELAQKLEEDRKRAIESINAVFLNLGEGVKDLLTDGKKLTSLVGGLSLLALGVYTSRETTRVAGKAFEKWFGTPKLVRETSRKPLVGRGNASVGKSLSDVKRDFGDIVLQPKLQDHVRALAAVTSNTKKHGAPFRHMLFYGPPGTGKTMAAKRLARTSGLDYAILSGGDIAPLQGGAVTQLHDTFDWAEKSRKGLLLFIDEADAFLGRRSGNMSEGLRGALNAMLFRTGDQSKDFCVVLATNRPSDLDPAVIDRMDEALEFGLPSEEERKKIIDIYFDKYIKGARSSVDSGSAMDKIKGLLLGRKSQADDIRINGITDDLLWKAAKKTDGFSGRELAKFMASVQAAVYGSHEAELTPAIFENVLKLKLTEHRQREVFSAGPTD